MKRPRPSAKKRRSGDLTADEPPPRATEATEAANLRPTTHSKEPPQQQPDAGGGDGDGGDVDRISSLPDAVLGEIVSLLCTKEAGRTQILASRWRHVWHASPLVVDATDLCTEPKDDEMFTTAKRQRGPRQRGLPYPPRPPRPRPPLLRPAALSPRPSRHRGRRLSSPALDNLQELDFWEGKHKAHRYDSWYERQYPLAQPPASTFRFSATLRVATLGKCKLPDSSVEGIHFPHLKQLGLEDVIFSEGSLNTLISSCPVQECLLLKDISGVGCLRISSNTLRSIGVSTDCSRDNLPLLEEVIIVDAPFLERCLSLGLFKQTQLTVISAPKLETLGCLDDDWFEARLVFGTIFIKVVMVLYFLPMQSLLSFVYRDFDIICTCTWFVCFVQCLIQGLEVVSLTTTLSSVKTLAVAGYDISLDMVIELMKCFPCLENLYMKSYNSGDMNWWRRKHRDFIKSSDIHLKKIVLWYRGIRSQINFVSFFLLNARELEVMSLEVEDKNYNEAFFRRTT